MEALKENINEIIELLNNENKESLINLINDLNDLKGNGISENLFNKIIKDIFKLLNY